jgi:hypothetical protein
MKYTYIKEIILIVILSYTNIFASVEKIYLTKGWNLKGTSYSINNTKDFLDTSIVKYIQVYRNNTYITSLMMGIIF